MKTLDQLYNTDKAGLLFDLFRNDIPAFIDYLEGKAAYIIREQQVIREKWQNGLLDFHEWLYLAKEISSLLATSKKRLATNKAFFILHLFNNYTLLFVCDCLEKYAARMECPPKMALAIHTLFHTGYSLPHPPKILLFIRGGVIRGFYSNMPDCRMLLVDYDLQQDGNAPVHEPEMQDGNFANGKSFMLVSADDPSGAEVAEALKRLKY